MGDVTGKRQLTPVAIAAGKAPSRTGSWRATEHTSTIEDISSVVFSHPPIGAAGLTEVEARELDGGDVKVYTTRFTNMRFGITERKPEPR